jgi:hypothetical protein
LYHYTILTWVCKEERQIETMKREHFSSRLGFILITAACSIGLGNIWRFPYITGKYGGASFVIFYLIFLVILGLPIVVMEFAAGRASQRFCFHWAVLFSFCFVPAVMGGAGLIFTKKRPLEKACRIPAVQESTSAIYCQLSYL